MNITPRFGCPVTLNPYDFQDTRKNITNQINDILRRTARMFEYTNLPDTIPSTILETYLQLYGHAGIIKHNGNLYAVCGGWGGEPNPYYIPTKYVVANPYLDVTDTFDIDSNISIIRNDSQYSGNKNLYEKYATMISTAETSIQIASINSRIAALIDAPDDRTKESAEEYLRQVAQGKLGVIAGNAFLDGIRTQPYGNASSAVLIKSLIEALQYIRANLYNEMGLTANYNMKREAISASEAGLNNDTIRPLIDDMFQCRKEDIEKLNELFGTDISVQFAGVWDENEQENELEREALELENELTESEIETNEEPEGQDNDTPESNPGDSVSGNDDGIGSLQ